jgi:hypothetical protein
MIDASKFNFQKSRLIINEGNWSYSAKDMIRPRKPMLNLLGGAEGLKSVGSYGIGGCGWFDENFGPIECAQPSVPPASHRLGSFPSDQLRLRNAPHALSIEA